MILSRGSIRLNYCTIAPWTDQPGEVGKDYRAYMQVNNRAEGNAPLTVEALVAQLRA